MALVAQKSGISKDMHSLFWLVYGSPKVGKSTFASGFPDAAFLTTEDAHRHLAIFNNPVKDWAHYLQLVQEIRTSKEAVQFKTVVVDTVSLLFEMCRRHVLGKKEIEHETDQGYGKGHDAVRMEFSKGILALTKSRKGVVFICHQKEIQVKGRGMEYSKVVPNLMKAAFEVINPLVDIICYCGFIDDTPTRYALFEPSQYLDAGDRTHMFSPQVELSYDAIAKNWATGPHGGFLHRIPKKPLMVGKGKPIPKAIPVAVKRPPILLKKK